MNAYLFKTNKSVKIVVISDEKPNYFTINKNVALSELLNTNTITYVDEFELGVKKDTGKFEKEDDVLSAIQPDILIKKFETNPKLIDYNNHACICIDSSKMESFQDYYTIFLMIDQILSIKSQLKLS